MKRRNTIQRNLVLQAVQDLRTHPTADEIYSKVAAQCPTISKGTVYRNLSALAEEGEILRVELPNAPDRFDFHTMQHHHFKCKSCGRVLDVEMPHMPLEQIAPSGMKIDGYDLVFKGLCHHCNRHTEH